MTEEEKKEYRENLTQQCKKYCHIDYDDDIDIVELMINTTLEEMQELIPNFDAYNMTSRQRLIALVSVKNLYDNREKYGGIQATIQRSIIYAFERDLWRCSSCRRAGLRSSGENHR